MVLCATQGIQNVLLIDLTPKITEIRMAAAPKPLRPLFHSIRAKGFIDFTNKQSVLSKACSLWRVQFVKSALRAIPD
jgi:hypothetical protein